MSDTALAHALADRYRIDRELGSGGMATVYLAEDVRHRRRVALKVLHPELSAVLGGDRFLKEIELTASLQHPHILPLFDSGSADGQLFYVMPFIEGETLRGRLERERQLPIEDAIRTAREVADALEYAHALGVIHRDIKPENILLQGGHALVADFGIALAVQQAGGQRMTQTGLSLGTPQYMSPEQATGERAIDARADVYALGAVTYEMLTGEPPFTGPTAQAIVARLLTTAPAPLRETRETVPPYVERTVLKALAKLPADRFSSAKAFANALDQPTQDEMRDVVTTAPRTSGRRRWARDAILLGIGAAIAATTTVVTRPTPRQQVPARFSLDLPDSATIPGDSRSGVDISPQGTRIAVICFKGGDTRVCLRNLADPVMTTVPGSEGADYVRFSPSGQSIAWSTSDGIRRASVSGGAVERVVNASRLNGVTWIDESHIAFVSGTELWSVRTNGADRRQIVRLPPEFLVLFGPSALPGGTHILVALSKDIGNPDSSHVAVVSLRDGKLTDLGVRGVGPRYVAPGWLAVVRADAGIHIMPFSLRSRSVSGSDTTAFTTVTGSSSGYAFSENGTAIYLSGDSRADQVIIAVDSNGVEHPFAPVGRAYREPRISPDGKHVVVRIGPGATNGDLWVQDVSSGSLSRLTRDGMSIRGEWTRDGKRIVFVNRPAADTEIVYSQPWDGSAGPTELVRSRKPYEYYQLGLGPPGGWTIVRSGQSASNELLIAPTDSLAKTKLFVHGSPSTMSPRISPNGHLVAYSSNETGRLEVYVRPLPGPGAILPVSIEGGTEPIWSPDGTRLYYRGPTRMMVANIVERPEPAVVRRDSLFIDRYRRYSQHSSYDVFANGQLLMTRNRSERTGIFVVTNWDAAWAAMRER